jgi:mRNA-degrading endonuclease RelE of RelBE toxin-antitoxin system
MYTVVETRDFQKQAAKVWSDDERTEFVSWIAKNPLAGDVIPGADGARKVRWAMAGKGKRGGVRVVYFHLSADGVLILVMVYAKSDRANAAPNDIRRA